MAALSFQQRLAAIDANDLPMVCMPTAYAPDTQIEQHAHRKPQPVCAVPGVMVVQTSAGYWVVPPTRAIWMPAGTVHAIRCVGAVRMRSLYVKPSAARVLPKELQVVGISPLLRELIQAAVGIVEPYATGSR